MRGISLIVIAGIVSGCGQINGSTIPVSSQELGLNSTLSVSSIPSGGGLVSGGVNGYNCPADVADSIVPIGYGSVTDDTSGNFSSGSFQVCTDPKSESDVMLIGEEGDEMICVIPVNLTGASLSPNVYGPQGQWIPDPNNNGMPMYSCQSLGSKEQTIFTFTGQNWDAAYVVTAQDLQTLQACLYDQVTAASTGTYCPEWPAFSYGSFR